MRALYFALAIVLLVVADMAVAGTCKNKPSCGSYGGTCGTHCLKTGYYRATCDCRQHGHVCCLPHKKG